MAFSPTLLALIKEKLPVSQVISLNVVLKKKGKEHIGICPFHQEKTPSFTINDEKGFYHCFGCGAHGNVFDFLQNQRNLSFPESVEYAAQMAHISIETHDMSLEDKVRLEAAKELKKITHLAHRWYCAQIETPKGLIAKHYLDERGLAPAHIAEYGIGYAPNIGLEKHLLDQGCSIQKINQVGLRTQRDDRQVVEKFRNRVMFPIENRRGDVIAFGGRRLGEFGPKYLNSPDTELFHKGKVLYNFFHARGVKGDGPLCVVEGYMDVVALRIHGHKSVAPMGTSVTPEQIKLMWTIDPAPIFIFDGDDAGMRATMQTMERFLPLLKPGYTCFFVLMPSGEDPDSFLRDRGPEAFRKILENKQSLIECVWAHISGLPHDTPEARALLEHACQNLLKTIEDKSIAYHYQQEVRAKLHQFFYGGSIPHRSSGKLFARPPIPERVPTEQVLLYFLVVYPDLWPHVHHEFSNLIVKSDKLYKLHESIVGYFCADGSLEHEPLIAYLSNQGHSATLERLVSLKRMLQARFFQRADVTLDARIAYWIDVYQTVYQRDLLIDQNEARQHLLDNMSPESWARYKALKSLSVQYDS